MPEISVVIPTFNEENNIVSILTYLNSLEPHIELIVADGASADNTVLRAQGLAKVTIATRGRGAQMNAGARIASGEILWFIHADCYPHKKSVQAILQILEDSTIVGGAFEYRLDDERKFFRMIEFFSNQKNRVLKLFYGDMGIFVRRKIFEAMGGYREIPLMEDMDFCKRLKGYGEIRILPYRILTSARRWHQEGILKNVVRNWALQIAWALGTSPERLARWYRFGNNQL